MNKLITAISIIVLSSFISSVFTTAEASQRKSHRQHHHKHHSHHHQQAGDDKQGLASWYGSRFQGRRTANGERYDMNAMTAAHNSLPLSSYVEVTNLHNNRSVIVRINDRGPFHGNRVMDLSYAAAKELGIQKSGTGAIQIRPLFENTTVAQLTDQPG